MSIEQRSTINCPEHGVQYRTLTDLPVRECHQCVKEYMEEIEPGTVMLKTIQKIIKDK